MKRDLTLIFLNLSFVLSFSNIYAQWDNDTLTGGKIIVKNFPLGNISNYASGNVVNTITDDKGGILSGFLIKVGIVGNDTTYNKMQRCDSLGNLLWGNADSSQQIIPINVGTVLDFIADGQGGIYLLYSFQNDFWTDSSRLYLQHIDANGQNLLPDKGFFIANTGKYHPGRGKICFTSDGNISVVWRIFSSTGRTYAYGQVFAQKISLSGDKLWGDTSLKVCTASGERVEFYISPDANGGIFVLFEDSRNGQIYNIDSGNYLYTNLDIYKQHISSTGSLESGISGLPLATGSRNQYLRQEKSNVKYILPNRNGGCYFMYYSKPDSILDTGDLYIQQLDSTGEPVWDGNGRFICRSNYLNDVYDERLLINPGGGISVVYLVNRDYTRYNGNYYLQIQTITPAGVQQYPDSSGKVLARTYDADDGKERSSFDAKYAGADTLLFIFKDQDTAKSIRVQKLLPDGTLAWDSAGKTFIRQKADMLQLFNSNANHFLIQWFDSRNHNSTDTVDVFLGKIDDDANIIISRKTIISTSNGNWDNPATWEGGTIPGPDDFVIIVHNVTISSDASCYSLKVLQPGGLVNVLPAVRLNILH